ncbi:MAG: J domain-containing protein [Deltaproteobacteria bacterium]|nr:J domain-containing protein [Deltaproteobacteria bacterium]MDQ3300019.1 J domain-containing protein [Myxococcota bacterium]
MAESFYEVLGVPKDASADAIRAAYRKLARKHHPDVNPGDKAAEEKFKKIATAYDVLGDDKKRAAYDEFGDASLQGGFDPSKAREYARWHDTRQQRSANFDDGPIEFDFAEMFGRSRGPARGRDLQATIQIELRQAIDGTELTADIPGQGPVRVRIPPGADTGSTLRVPGKGSPGGRGGPPGDLVIEVEVRPHPRLRREGLDLHLALPVTLDEAYNGASVDVPTFEGSIVLKIPPRSQNHAKLRVRGKGVPRKDTRGDLIVELDIRMPDKADDALVEALRGSATAYSAPVRGDLKL